MTLALAVTLPAAFALGIAARQGVPVSRARVPGFSDEVRERRLLWKRDDLWETNSIQTRLLTIGPDPGPLAVELASVDRVVRPDVLVYWLPGAGKVGISLPDNAYLLGAFEPSKPIPLPWPVEAANQGGSLVLYSLADQEIVAVSRSFSLR